LGRVESFGHRSFTLGKIIYIDGDIYYIRNEHQIKPKFIGHYLTSVYREKNNGSITIPCLLEVKNVTDSLVTAQITKKPINIDSDSNNVIKDGDEVLVEIQDIYSYNPQEICSYWYWYA
jgi:hypothetical protein